MAAEAQRGAGRAARRLRARWLEPSPPLAIDDEPVWVPAPDPVDEDAAEVERARGAASRFLSEVCAPAKRGMHGR